VPLQFEGRRVHVKCEHLNPTGSFKDRGTAVLVSALAAAGVERAVEDSSGNAGASFAAYAARAGIQARVFVPDDAAGPKRAQIEAYGAEVVRILGPRSGAADAVRRAAAKGEVYASHAYLPHILAGMATLAFEIVEQLGKPPGALIVPVGQGSLLLGVYRGFQAMEAAGVIDAIPQLIGVQAQACAPLWAVYTLGASGLAWVHEGETLAEGIRILHPHRGDAVLEALEATGGDVVAVDEEDIRRGLEALSQRGFFVEPTSAVVWPAMKAVIDQVRGPLVVVLTGSGFKDLRPWAAPPGRGLVEAG
jgi:threonine synthase